MYHKSLRKQDDLRIILDENNPQIGHAVDCWETPIVEIVRRSCQQGMNLVTVRVGREQSTPVTENPDVLVATGNHAADEAHAYAERNWTGFAE